jgi:hypothetical protein
MLSFATTWVELEDFVLNEMGQAHKDKHVEAERLISKK